MALLSVDNALFGKPYLWDRHNTYQSRSQKVTVKIRNQWYGILERQPTSTVAMIFGKQTVAPATIPQNSKNFRDPPLSWISLFFFPTLMQ